MTAFKSIIAGLGLAFAASTASAATIINNSEAGLQALLDSSISGGSINAETDYIANDGYWELTNGAISSATFMLELTGNKSTQSFGIYDVAADGSISYVEVFDGANTAADRNLLTINADGTVTVLNGSTYAIENTGTIGADGRFGFYVANGNGGVVYSDDKLNGDVDKMLAYSGRDGLTIDIDGDNINALAFTDDDFILAFEDWVDNDFQDLVVNISSVKPVPAPSSLVLMGLGLIGLAAVRRRQTA